MARNRAGESQFNPNEFDDTPAQEEEAPANSDSITISGQEFRVPSPYSAGHALTQEEAAVLNQRLHEAIRNGMSKKVKEGGATQEQVDEFANGFRFGTRRRGSRIGDPVRKAAVQLAVAKIEAKIKSNGEKVSDYSRADIIAKAKTLVDTRPEYMETARRNVEAANALPDAD